MILIKIIHPGEVWVPSFLSFLAADCESPISKRCIYSNPDFKGEGREEDNLAKIWHTFWKFWNSMPQPFTGPWIAALSHGKAGVQTQASQFAATCLQDCFVHCAVSCFTWSCALGFKVVLGSQRQGRLTDLRHFLWNIQHNETFRQIVCMLKLKKPFSKILSVLQGQPIVYFQYIKWDLVLKSPTFINLKSSFNFWA